MQPGKHPELRGSWATPNHKARGGNETHSRLHARKLSAAPRRSPALPTPPQSREAGHQMLQSTGGTHAVPHHGAAPCSAGFSTRCSTSCACSSLAVITLHLLTRCFFRLPLAISRVLNYSCCVLPAASCFVLSKPPSPSGAQGPGTARQHRAKLLCHLAVTHTGWHCHCPYGITLLSSSLTFPAPLRQQPGGGKKRKAKSRATG